MVAEARAAAWATPPAGRMTALPSSQTWAGRLPGANVPSFIQQHANVFESFPFILVSSVDSDRNVIQMPWARARIRGNAQWALSPSQLVIAGENLVRLARDSVFNGFDELWVTMEPLTISPPAGAYLVAPRELANPAPDAVRRWMEQSGSRLGLGDGYGLNFVVNDRELARQLHLPGIDRRT